MDRIRGTNNMKKLAVIMLALAMVIGTVVPASMVSATDGDYGPIVIHKVIPAEGPEETFTFNVYRDFNNNGILDFDDPLYPDTWVADVVIDTAVTDTGQTMVPWLGPYVVHEQLSPGSVYQQPPDQAVKVSTCGRVDLTFTNELGELPGKIRIVKVDEAGNEIELPGATFTVDPNPYGAGVLTVEDNVSIHDAASALGVILLENIPVCIDYTITEVTPPDGYERDPDSQTQHVASAAEYIFVFMNKMGKIKIVKVDEAGSIIDLPGASFTVDPNPYDGGTLFVVDNVSIEDADPALGVILLEHIPICVDYTVTEVEAPGDYERDPTPQTKHVASSAVYTFTFVNTREELGELKILKVDGDGAALAGAEFLITPDPKTGTDSLVLVDNGLNDEDMTVGTLLVTNCIIGTVCTVEETKAPDGYDPAPAQDVTISATVTLTFVNTPKKGELKILKVDGTGAALAGAEFLITPNPKTGSDSLVLIDNGTNDEDMTVGTLLVTNCIIGTVCTVEETKAPTGYDPAPAQDVTISATVTLTFVNTPKQEGGTPGYWSSPAAMEHHGKAQLAEWFRTIVLASAWFEDGLANPNDNTAYNNMVGILNDTGAKGYKGAVNQFRAQYLATRLNALSGRLGLATPHDITGVLGAETYFGYPVGSLGEIIDTIEAKAEGEIFKPLPTRDDVLIMKSVCDMLNNP
jgi:hypothetical protein